MTFSFRGDIEVPQRLILGKDKTSYISYQNAGLALVVNNETQLIIGNDGATIADDVVLNSVIISRTGTNPIQIVDISNSNIGLGLGLIIDNSYTDDDYRVYLPKTNTQDHVIFNNGPDVDTAIVKCKKYITDDAGNIFTKYSLGGTIYDSMSDIFIGAIANVDGALGICQPINGDTITGSSELDPETAFGIVSTLAAKTLTWDGDNRDVTFDGFHGDEVALKYAAATFDSPTHGVMVCQERLFPVLWSAVRWLISNYEGQPISG